MHANKLELAISKAVGPAAMLAVGKISRIISGYGHRPPLHCSTADIKTPAPICFIELVDFDPDMAKGETKKKTRRSRRGGAKTEAAAAAEAPAAEAEAPAAEEQKAE